VKIGWLDGSAIDAENFEKKGGGPHGLSAGVYKGDLT